MEADVEQSPSPYPRLGAPEENLGNPWWFVTPLYFMQAIPAALVNDVAPLIYKEFGVDNASITRWTSLVALPWAVKMFFGPFVELNSTRRKWILATQALIVLGILGVAFSMKMPNFAAFSLATCDCTWSSVTS